MVDCNLSMIQQSKVVGRKTHSFIFQIFLECLYVPGTWLVHTIGSEIVPNLMVCVIL